MRTAEFESLIILSMEKPNNSTLSGVMITAVVQFGGLNLNQENYEQEWSIISNNSQILGDWIIGDSEVSGKNWLFLWRFPPAEFFGKYIAIYLVYLVCMCIFYWIDFKIQKFIVFHKVVVQVTHEYFKQIVTS